jgi:hypothetical protein
MRQEAHLPGTISLVTVQGCGLLQPPTINHMGRTSGYITRQFLKYLLLLLLVAPASVQAHVKWFVEADVGAAPRPVGEVLTQGIFVHLFLVSVAAIYGFFLVDRWAVRKRVLAKLDERMKRFDGACIHVMRISAAVFFASVSAWYWSYGESFYLTPELRTSALWVPYLHAMMAIAALGRRTAPFTGLGICFLYAAAVQVYGAYHLADYVIFLGIGYFLLVSGLTSVTWRKSGFIVLFASTGLTLTWAAMEKFAYPHWTFTTLAANPDMLMGMTPLTFMIVSGFVEFNLAFVLLSAASMIGRLVALGLQSVFILAIFKFGLTDALGHLMIIAILFVLFFRGPTDARNMLVLEDKSVWTEAYFMTGLYFLAFVMMFLGYYGLHLIYYGV